MVIIDLYRASLSVNIFLWLIAEGILIVKILLTENGRFMTVQQGGG